MPVRRVRSADSPARTAGVLAWQGWALRAPGRSSPVKIEGDYTSGYVLLADLHRPRLGLRWKQIGRRADPAKAVIAALAAEVGQLAAREARPHNPAAGLTCGLLYEDNDPVQRDVWVGYSPLTRRVVQLAFPIQRRERLAVAAVLGSLTDQNPTAPAIWSVFELQAEIPAGLSLVRHRLNSGDLGLTFSGKPASLAVRQVAPASVALTRLKPERWLANQESRLLRHYRAVGEPESTEIAAPQGVLRGLSRNLRLKKRYSWVWWLARRWQTVCLHDEPRDRLTIVQSTDPQLVGPVAASVGHAASKVADAPAGILTGEAT